MVQLLETDHLSDQLAGLSWLRNQRYVRLHEVAVAGQSFGGIETVLGTEKARYCAAVDVSGGAESWALAPELQRLMISAVRSVHVPIFFVQPENDFDLSPSRVLSATMEESHKPYKLRIYPAFGNSPEEGHSFAYKGAAVWTPDALEFLTQNCLERH
jgi:dipeptidyl aminopeptidase/acylaminoacyl peptidase